MGFVSIAAVVVALGEVAAADPDAAFRDAAQQLASASHRKLAAWGTARLDGSRAPHQFATLVGDARGAYVIEQAPDAFWLVTFAIDGRTEPFHGDSTRDPVPWVVLADTAVTHIQTHHHGIETVTFGLRGDALVELSYYSHGDASDPGDRPLKHTYARATAPALASAFVRESQLAVSGPASSIAALIEPAWWPLHVDFDQVQIATDADALALWAKLAPTGEDLGDKLSQIPDGPVQIRLALAVLHAGNFTCPAAPASARCGLVHALASPAAMAGFSDPCIRHAIALWALEVLRTHDAPGVDDALRTIAKLPLPAGDEIERAIAAASTDPLQRELAMTAWRAGHHDSLAIDRVLATATDRELATLLGDPVTATAGDCATAALAAIVRERAGDLALVPARPATRDSGAMTRELCILAHYTALGGKHASLASFVALTGVNVVDHGNPAPPIDELPEAVGAARCAGTTCTTDDVRVRFVYVVEAKHLALSQIQLTDRPACR